jgi:UDP-N-acetylglucosamine 2-epimerase
LVTHPRIRQKIEQVGSNYPNIYFMEPLSYLVTIFFATNANMIITDSGGLYTEAYLHETPCVTILRSVWLETTKGGWNQFVAPVADDMIAAVTRRKFDKTVRRDDFGDGNAYCRVVELLKEYFDDPSLHLY